MDRFFALLFVSFGIIFIILGSGFLILFLGPFDFGNQANQITTAIGISVLGLNFMQIGKLFQRAYLNEQ